MKRRAQAGLTLIEVMIASAVLVVMMSLAWRTIANTSDSRKRFEKYEQRNHELRMAMSRIVADFEHAYLSRNEDQTSTYPRTMYIAKSGSKLPEIRFSTLGHTPGPIDPSRLPLDRMRAPDQPRVLDLRRSSPGRG